MRIPTDNIEITAEPGFLFYVAILVLIIPIRLLFAWFIAVIIHELGHFIMLQLLHIKIYALKFKICGVLMISEPIDGWREAVCAAAGPLAGLCVSLFAEIMPCTAIVALFHSAYNLLPIYPLDGGRIIRCIFREFRMQRAKIPLKTAVTNSTIVKTAQLRRNK